MVDYNKLIRKFRKSLTFLVIIFIVSYMFYLKWDWITSNVPLINWMQFTFKMNFVEKTLLGMFLSSIIGSFFFVFLPIEFQFAYYATSKHNIFLVGFILLIGNVIGLSGDYLLGHMFGEKLARKALKKKYKTFNKFTEKFAGFFVFFGNLLIFPIEVFSVIVGSSKYTYKKFLLYTFLGKVIKFGVMIFLITQFGITLNYLI